MNGIDVKIVRAMLREFALQRTMREVRALQREFNTALDDSDALAALGARWAQSAEPFTPDDEEARLTEEDAVEE